MIRGFTLLWYLLATIVVPLILHNPSEAADYGPYTLQAPIAIDGDTIQADVLIWPNIVADAHIRVVGVDTPELHATALCERTLAQKAKTFTDAWILSHQPITIANIKPDKYSGRVDAEVIGKDGTLLTEALIAAGIGRPYNGGARLPGWCP